MADDRANGTKQLLYGPLAYQLRAQLLQHITTSLPLQMNAFSSSLTSLPTVANTNLAPNPPATGIASSSGQQQLLKIYAGLPFSVFKTIMESSDFPPSDMERFSFAKKVIAERKKLQGRDAPTNEVAVLAFGSSGQGSSNVQVVAKAKRQQPALWKVES